MKKYHFQKSDFACGPVAIFNTLIWAKNNVKFDDYYPDIFKSCKTDKEGTEDVNFINTINKYAKLFNIKVKERKRINLNKLREYLAEPNHAALVSHLDFYGEFHWSLWIDSGGWTRSFTCVNIDDKDVIACISQDGIERLLKNTRKKEPVQIFLLEKS